MGLPDPRKSRWRSQSSDSSDRISLPCGCVRPFVGVAPVLVSELIGCVTVLFWSRTSLIAKNLFLRKQLAFYQEHKRKPQPLTDAARWTLVLCSRLFDWRSALVIVKPDNLIGWHHKGFNLFRRWRSGVAGRPCRVGFAN